MISQRFDNLVSLGQTYRGNMGIMYTAFDKETQQKVFIKAADQETRFNPKRRAMFEREISLAFTLKHKHILPPIAMGEDVFPLEPTTPVLYIVYPFMEDGSLGGLLASLSSRQSFLPLMQVADIILQAASGLSYMHNLAQPIVHWDVKPDNFLIRKGNDTRRAAYLYLTDFGISRPIKGYYYSTGTAWGTPSHMAPEQFRKQIFCQSDQYALAVMACQLLTGKYPLQAVDITNYEAWNTIHQLTQPTLPSRLNPTRISPNMIEIDRVILKALKKQPAQRYPSIWAFAKALYSAIEKYTDGQLPEETFNQLAATVSDDSSRRSPVLLNMPINTNEYLIAEPQEPIQSSVPQKPSGISLLPKKNAPVSFEYSLQKQPYTICWSPSGEALACSFLSGAPCIISNTGLEETILDAYAGHVVCWGPQKQMLAIGASYKDHSKITIIDTYDRSILPFELNLKLPRLAALDWSIHGHLAIWAENEEQLRIYTIPHLPALAQKPASTLVSTQHINCTDPGTLRWSPDGEFLAVAGKVGKDGAILLLNADTRAPYRQHPNLPGQIVNIAWSLDSSLLAIAFKNRRIAVLNIQTNKWQVEWNNLPLIPRTISISPEKILVVASSQRYLLLGTLNDLSSKPITKHDGYLMAQWSTRKNELVTLDPTQDTHLKVYAF